MAKSADAFRTISEVADWLGSPAHVLRFWESKFTQVKPVKRAGGRRYYRPADMELIGGIKKLLHDDGMTIKGVQKILREQGVKYVSSLSQPLDFEPDDMIEATAVEIAEPPARPTPEPAEAATVVPFQRTEPATPAPAPEPDHAETAVEGIPAADTSVFEDFATAPSPEPESMDDDSADEEDASDDTDEMLDDLVSASPDDWTAEDDLEEDEDEEDLAAASAEAEPAPAPDLPAFLRTPFPAPEPEAEPEEEDDLSFAPDLAGAGEPEPEPELAQEPEPEPLRPAQIDVPPDPADDALSVPPGVLGTLAARKGVPLPYSALAQATALRASLAALHARLTGNAPQ